jgi:hypothetical protein
VEEYRKRITHLEEFYAVIPDSAQLEKLDIALYKGERVFTQIRPHQALDYLTPLSILRSTTQL